MSQHPDDTLDRLQREVERMFHGLIYHRHPSAHFCEAAWVPSADLMVSEDSAHVVLELAGVPPENVRVTLRGRILEVSGRRDTPREPGRADYHRAEIFFGEFRRTIELPWEADEDRVDARYRNGMLDIVLHPAVVNKPTDVTVEGSHSG
jgi:HSP20 family protein